MYGKSRGVELKENVLTVSRQSIIRRNSLSSMLSSLMGMPPTLAYRLLVQKASQRALLDTAMDVMTKRWQVSEDRVNSGILAQIWSM